MQKMIIIASIALSLIVVGGCRKIDSTPEIPISEEAIVETTVNNSGAEKEDKTDKTTHEVKYWDIMESKTEEELEETEDIYFVNTAFDENDCEIDVTVSKIYYEEMGLFVELNIYNGLDKTRTNFILNSFSLDEIIDFDESNLGKDVVLVNEEYVGIFKDVVVKSGENKLVNFIVPTEKVQNEAYNFERINYNWSLEFEIGDEYSLN